MKIVNKLRAVLAAGFIANAGLAENRLPPVDAGTGPAVPEQREAGKDLNADREIVIRVITSVSKDGDDFILKPARDNHLLVRWKATQSKQDQEMAKLLEAQISKPAADFRLRVVGLDGGSENKGGTEYRRLENLRIDTAPKKSK